MHPLYLYSAMSDASLRTSSLGRRASASTSQESWTAYDGGCYCYIHTRYELPSWAQGTDQIRTKG
jgi:hypothetical protein